MKLLFSFLFLFLFSSFSIEAADIAKFITVDRNGGGDFNTVQAAVNSVPDGNNQWIQINIKAGVYWEKVDIPFGKGFIALQGDGASGTSIEWGDYAPPKMGGNGNMVADTATFTITAVNVVVKGLTIKNTNQQAGRAIAALIQGDKVSFYQCKFIGIQDTLSDLVGRHYFKDCYIEGAVDFIFGSGQSIYEGCTLSTVPSRSLAGWVTANGRLSPEDSSGYVFKNCNLVGSAKTYLGRVWRPYSRVVFYQTNMSDIVVPQGWDYWRDPSQGAYSTYAESSCSGNGSSLSGRVQWQKTLSNEEVAKFVSISYIDDGWLGQQP